jgi:hypothetical protein
MNPSHQTILPVLLEDTVADQGSHVDDIPVSHLGEDSTGRDVSSRIVEDTNPGQ